MCLRIIYRLEFLTLFMHLVCMEVTDIVGRFKFLHMGLPFYLIPDHILFAIHLLLG